VKNLPAALAHISRTLALCLRWQLADPKCCFSELVGACFKVVLLGALPLEIANLWLLDRPLFSGPLKAEGIGLNFFQLLGFMAAAGTHHPAGRLLSSTGISETGLFGQALLFVSGYIEFVLLFFVLFLLYRMLKWCVSTRYFGSA
jgi:hypothetical protein